MFGLKVFRGHALFRTFAYESANFAPRLSESLLLAAKLVMKMSELIPDFAFIGRSFLELVFMLSLRFASLEKLVLQNSQYDAFEPSGSAVYLVRSAFGAMGQNYFFRVSRGTGYAGSAESLRILLSEEERW